MKTKYKVISIISLITFFVLFDVAFFFSFTYMFLPNKSESMRAKSIEIEQYLPFVEDTKIVKKNDSLSLEGDKPIIDCATALYPVASAFVNSIYEESDVEFKDKNFTESSKLQLNNTGGAYKRIVDGTSDIGLLAKPSEQQIEYAKSKGVEFVLTPIGFESFVFLVHKNNPIDSLTVDQIRGIYKGDYSNWKELGGDNKSIVPIQRATNSGSQTAFLSFMKGEETIKKPLNIFGSAIGFSFRFYVDGIVQNGDIKMLGLNGVYPSKENVQNKSYPIVSNFYAVTSSKNTNPNVEKVLNWMKSETDETGYVRL